VTAPQTGQRVVAELTPFIAKAKGLGSREVSGEVLRVTPRAVEMRVHCVVRESDWCLNCGREIDNPISRLVGYGPICSDHLGIPRPERLDPATIDEIRRRVETETVVTDWFPLSQVTFTSVAGTPRADLPARAPQPRIIDHNGSQFILRFPYDEAVVNVVRGIRGRQWLTALRVWVLPTEAAPDVLMLVQDYGFTLTPAAQAVIDGDASVDMLVASSAHDADIEVAGLGGTLRPFQKAGVAYAARQKRVILGDQPGLGKTCQALATIQYLGSFPAVVVCPASLRLNWKREAERWLPGKVVTVANTPGLADRIGDITILSYDVLPRYVDWLKSCKPKALVMDESHMAKNPTAKRTKAAMKLADKIDVKLLLTGTAIMNRPLELEPQLRILGRLQEVAPGGLYPYANANGKKLVDLNRKLRGVCYIRREKADVLTELPPKTRTTLPIEIDNRREYDEAHRDLIHYLRVTAVADKEFRVAAKIRARADDAEFKARQAEHLVRITALKRLAAKGKMAAAVSWVEDFLAGSDEKIILFGHHVEVVEELGRRFNCPIIRGGMSDVAKQAAVDRFQSDASTRVIALNMQSGGVGLTLTAANNVAFLELAWNPALHDQCEDRAHRIGQVDNVTCTYLVAVGTIEEDIGHLIDAKRGVVDASLIGDEADSGNSIMSDLIDRLMEEAA
jgi:hypothetical protein